MVFQGVKNADRPPVKWLLPFHMAESTVGCGWTGEIAMRRVCPTAGQPIKERAHAKQNAKWMHKKLFTSSSNVADKFLQ
ncbi:hypothetical protein DSCW_37420 [Desulfosarcina widdelii]|uniref:Uncharacterized protein n=1 Tax=Desulfosarcina widdelii TaxID=947919 RepID=A0A5K7Z6I7_9BACT|nr:hypothetical protein DSCW_37420 [Desulfosarcina widdelii]